MNALGQETTALTAADQAAIARATAVLPACYTDGLSACLNPHNWEDPDRIPPQNVLPVAECALINAAYDTSDAAWTGMEAVVDALPLSTEICGQCPAPKTEQNWIVLASVGGAALILGAVFGLVVGKRKGK